MSRTAEEKSGIIKDAQKHANDTGSPEVQVTLLTDRIKYLTEHFKKHNKDLHSKRGLQAMVNRRKKLLKYLKSRDHGGYTGVIKKLGLRDSY